MEMRRYPHAPPHPFVPGVKYWVTGSTYKHKPLFGEPEAKWEMIRILQKGCEKYGWGLDDWVILDDHYHLMLEASGKKENTIAVLINSFHRFSGLWLRKQYPAPRKEKRIFCNYWDTCITYESSYYARLNYLYYNPVKHGYVPKAEDYPFGSYYFRFRREGIRLEELARRHPFDRLELE